MQEDMLSPWRGECDSDQCCVLGSLVVMMLTQLARGQGSTPRWGTEFFQIAKGHFDPLLHLVANVISELEMHEDMLSPWRGECDSDQCCVLGSLVVMMLTQLARGQSSTPHWGTEFFQIAKGHFDPLL